MNTEAMEPATTNIYKIFPTVPMLENKHNAIHCPVEDCSKILTSSPALSIHLKFHSRKIECPYLLHYHCPIAGCVYDKLSERHFTCLKYLKQHYMKVHAERILRCESCRTTFAQKCLLDCHIRECGKKFECSCGKIYSSKTTLQTHANRKRHRIVDQSENKKLFSDKKQNKYGENDVANPCKTVVILLSGKNESETKIRDRPRLLLPKPAPLSSIPLQTLAALALSELSVFREGTPKSDTATQTELSLMSCPNHNSSRGCRRSSLTGKNSNHNVKRVTFSNNVSLTHQTLVTGVKRSRRTTETQTRGCGNKGTKRQKTSAQTQTLGNHILEKAMAEANLLDMCSNSPAKENVDYFPRQSIHTQTIEQIGEQQSLWSQLAETTSCLQLAKMDAVVNCTDLIRNTSSTQTCVNDLNERQSNSSQTEKDVFLGQFDNVYSLDRSLAEFGSSPLTPDSDDRESSLYDMLERSNSDERENLVHTSETQTELDLDTLLMCDDDDQSDIILCSNTHTQTTDDDLESISYDQLLTNMQTQTSELLFPELSFSDIQTQTSCSDLFVETALHCTGNVLTNVAQTQTLSQLENCTEFTDSHTQTHVAVCKL